MPKITKKRIHKEAKDLFAVLDESANLRQLPQGILTYKGKILPEEMKSRIAGEAKVIMGLEFWEILMDDMRQVACRKIYEEATNEDLIVFGKAMLYTLDVLQKKLYNLSKLKTKKVLEKK